MPDRHVDHAVLAAHAQNKVNVPSDEARNRRRQVNHLRVRLEGYIGAHPGFDLVKLRGSGSTAKHTAIRRRRGEGSDADVAAYVRASSVGGTGADESGLLEWTRDRCIEVYGATKDAEDFVISEHAVGITLRGSGLKIDVAPVLYEGAPDDRGYLITRQGDRVLTSVTLHLAFIRARRDVGGPELPGADPAAEGLDPGGQAQRRPTCAARASCSSSSWPTCGTRAGTASRWP